MINGHNADSVIGRSPVKRNVLKVGRSAAAFRGTKEDGPPAL